MSKVQLTELSAKQLAVFKYLAEFQKEYDNFPTSRCMMEDMKWYSQNSAMFYFKKLEEKGYIESVRLEGKQTLRRFTDKGRDLINNRYENRK